MIENWLALRDAPTLLRDVSPTGAREPTRASTLIQATPAEIMCVIADISAYPSWVIGVRQAEVLTTGGEGRPARVRLHVGHDDVIDEQTYTFRWHGDGGVDWSLTAAQTLRSLSGAYLLIPIDRHRTVVTHQLVLESKVQLDAPLRRRVELVFINRALPHLKYRAENPAHIPEGRTPAE